MPATYRKQVPSLKRYGDFVVFFKHATIEGESEPIMVIGCPKYRSAYIIPLKSAHMFADSITGEPTDYLVKETINIANVLRLGASRTATYRLASAIVDNLPELIKMPPHPGMTKQEIERRMEREGLVMRINGETIIDAR